MLAFMFVRTKSDEGLSAPQAFLEPASKVAKVEGESDFLVAQTLINTGMALFQRGLYKEALAKYDEVIARFGDASAAEVRGQVARAMAYKGYELSRANQLEETLVVLDEVIARFGNAPEPEVREWVALAMFSKGLMTLREMSRPQEGIAVYDALIARFGEESGAELREQVAWAMIVSVLRPHLAK